MSGGYCHRDIGDFGEFTVIIRFNALRPFDGKTLGGTGVNYTQKKKKDKKTNYRKYKKLLGLVCRSSLDIYST